MCIRVMGGSFRRFGNIGDVIIASVITSTIGALLVTHRDRNIDALRRKA